MTRAAIWTALGVGVVLAARTIAYALAPWQTLAVAELEHKAGGPQLAAVLAGGLISAALLAAAVLWVAVVAVRERLALERRCDLVAAPKLRPLRLAARALVFFTATSFAFAMLESYLHWRAGLGWHGLQCLVGPVHRDAIPVLAGLTLLAVSLHGAVEHLLAWARRLVALLAARLPLLRGVVRIFSSTTRPRSARVGSAAAPRGPPAGALA